MIATTLIRKSVWLAAVIALTSQIVGCSGSVEREATATLLETATEYSKADFLHESELFSAAARVRQLKFSDSSLASEAEAFAEALRVAAQVSGDIESKKQRFTEVGEAREMAAAKILRTKAKEVIRLISNVTGSPN